MNSPPSKSFPGSLGEIISCKGNTSSAERPRCLGSANGAIGTCAACWCTGPGSGQDREGQGRPLELLDQSPAGDTRHEQGDGGAHQQTHPHRRLRCRAKARWTGLFWHAPLPPRSIAAERPFRRLMPIGLTVEFASDAQNRDQWTGFLKRNRLAAPALEAVIKELAGFLRGPLREARVLRGMP